MGLEVFKFGGSSLRSLDDMEIMADKIARYRQKGIQVVAVVSAMHGSTDRLIDLARCVSAGRHCREVDRLLSTGEQQSVALLAMALERKGIKAMSLSGSEAGIRGKGRYGDFETMRPQSSAKDQPNAAAALGTRLVAVMPGAVLTSSTKGSPSVESLRSTRL